MKVEKYPVRLGAGEHHGHPPGLRHRRRRARQLPDPLPAQRRLGAPARSRSSRRRSSASRASCRCSSPTTARATAACSRSRRRPSWRPRAAPTACSACCPGTMGLLQATEVIKLILGEGEPLIGRLLMYDALAARVTEVKVRRDPALPDLLARSRRDHRRRARRLPGLRGVLRRRRTRVRRAMATVRIPPVLRPSVGGEKELTAEGDVRRRDPARRRRPPPRHAVAAVRPRRRPEPLRQRLPERRGRARARRSRHRGRRGRHAGHPAGDGRRRCQSEAGAPRRISHAGKSIRGPTEASVGLPGQDRHTKGNP